MTDGELGILFEDGEIIFRRGDPANCLYIIQSGTVLVYQETEGVETPIGELGQGESFGDMGVFLGSIRTESARSLGTVRVITADYTFVLKKFRDDPAYAFQVIEKMAQRDLAREEAQDKMVEAHLLRETELLAENQELREAGQGEGEVRDRTADFYDFAPVAAIDLDGEGIIRGINLAGAAILGGERQALLELSFAGFVPQEHQVLFRDHLQACHHSPEGVITVLLLSIRKGDPTKVQIFSYPKQDAQQVVYRTLLTELAVLGRADA